MKKITIMALHLGYGGIEKAISDLANNLVADFNVEIVSTYKLYEDSINKLDDNVKVKYLMNDRKPNRNEFFSYLKKLRFIQVFKEGIKGLKTLYYKKKLMVNYLKNCESDIIISTRTFHNTLLSKYGSKNSVRIAWEHNYHNNNQKYINKLINSVKELDYFVVVSNTLYNDYSKLLTNTNCKCVYIPNMVNIINSKLSKVNNHNLITVSRLSKEKGLFDLVDVVELVKNEIKDIKLNLIGDGDLFDSLLAYVKDKNLKDNVSFLGYMKSNDVYKEYLKSSLYVMTSFTESFGIVLLESFTFGVPAIAFDSANGACEIINSNNGILIANRDKKLMADTIINYLNDDNLRDKLSKGTQKDLQKYAPECIIVAWKKLFR